MSEYRRIELKEATIEDISLLESYLLEENQYADMPIKAMTNSLHETEKSPILILSENNLVGFFILQKNKIIGTTGLAANCLFLKDHSIDERYQSKGYGKLSIEALSDYVKNNFDGVDKITLTVDYDNLSGQMLYLKTGFKDTKKRCKENGNFKFIYSKRI